MKLKKGVVLQKMGGSFVAFDNSTSTLHELNETAYFILGQIEKNRSKTEILEELERSFKEDKKVMEKDYEWFIELLKSKDLIVEKK